MQARAFSEIEYDESLSRTWKMIVYDILKAYNTKEFESKCESQH